MLIAGNWKMNCNIEEANEIALNLSSLEYSDSKMPKFGLEISPTTTEI